MHTLRTRLVAAFVFATVLPLAATIWITTSLLERSLGYATTGELDRLSRALEATGRQFYRRERDALRLDALAGRLEPTTYRAAEMQTWPEAVRAFWDSGEAERFGLSGTGGDHVSYFRRQDQGVAAYTRDLHGVRMEDLSSELRQTRALVGALATRDLRRGFTLTLLLLVAAVWMVSLAPVLFMAHRISRPIQQLTAGLNDFAAGDWSRRIDPAASGAGEVGRAVDAFNQLAEQLHQHRERLVQLTRIASWQSLARKTAHELKNSLTPIRLTVEEMLARHPPADRAFMDQAAHIVVGEIESLERRVRAFSEFASEPPVNPGTLDLNALATERISLLRPAYADTRFQLKLAPRAPLVHADADLLKGVLTNLLQNAADAAGREGTVLIATGAGGDFGTIEVHDSGPGIRDDAAATLFEPTISFKSHGMGLGLSIAKRNALLSGGDVVVVPGALGGAAFRVTLPLVSSAAAHAARGGEG